MRIAVEGFSVITCKSSFMVLRALVVGVGVEALQFNSRWCCHSLLLSAAQAAGQNGEDEDQREKQGSSDGKDLPQLHVYEADGGCCGAVAQVVGNATKIDGYVVPNI